MNEARWFALCLISGTCVGVGVVFIGAGFWLYSLPFLGAGLWYGREAHKEAGR